MSIYMETTIKGASLLRTGRLMAERDHLLAKEMVAAAQGATGLVGYRRMVARGIELGQDSRRSRQMASVARRIAAFERPWWVEGGRVHATGLICDGREFLLT